uniref:Uncharacterized protein n=1 Tax=Erwinia amylovora TaxID=552 RepID=Q9F7Z8_ERWAM|nr:unknown [Erwinia amylovora]
MMLNARLFRDFLCLPDRVPEPFPFLRCGKDKFEFISHPVNISFATGNSDMRSSTIHPGSASSARGVHGGWYAVKYRLVTV